MRIEKGQKFCGCGAPMFGGNRKRCHSCDVKRLQDRRIASRKRSILRRKEDKIPHNRVDTVNSTV